MGVFNRILARLARQAGEPERLMVDATHLKANRFAASPLQKVPLPATRDELRVA
nr:hypothetical protein [Roseomonas sp. KE2513]